MIVTPENMSFDSKKFSMILYGSPGVGKTTLALSAPDPVLIDFDRGMSRVKAQHRKPAIFCDTYEEVLKDLGSPAMKDFQTIVVDTGGSFITFLQDWAMRSDPKVLHHLPAGLGHAVRSESEPAEERGHLPERLRCCQDRVRPLHQLCEGHAEQKPDLCFSLAGAVRQGR